MLINIVFQQPGKFSIEEFEQIGTINGLPAHEFNLDSLEDKPWRKPGADITGKYGSLSMIMLLFNVLLTDVTCFRLLQLWV